ncbi:MAG: flagellar M-ring protein FliF [Acidobacteria bacterium]|nr:MAG: flagellar M-ring protein FliF [Acidobacteriota bacterium]
MAEEKGTGGQETSEKMIKVDVVKFIQGLNKGQLISLGIMLATAIFLLGSVVLYLSQEKMVPLFREPLDAKTFIEIKDILQNRKVPFETERNNKILVPETQADDLRVEFEALDMTSKGKDGYTYLDQTNPLQAGETMMVIQRLRAKEANLARYLQQNPGIKNAYVSITPAKDSPFADEQQPAKASVMLELNKANRMSKSSVEGIQQYIANAIEGAKAEHVVITDQYHNLLSSSTPEDEDAALSQINLQIKNEMERKFIRKILNVVEPILGPGKAVAQVSLDVNFNKKKTVQKVYGGPDNEGEPLAQSTETKEELTNQNATGNPAGAGANVAQGSIPNNANGSSTTKRTATTNYLIDEKQTTVVEAPFEITRISVALNLDYREVENGEIASGFFSQLMGSSDAYEIQTEALSEEELTRIESLVKAAVGFVPKRDYFSINNFEFKPIISKRAAAQLRSGQLIERLKQWTPWIMQVVVFFAFILIATRMFKRFVVPILEQAQLEEPVTAPALPSGTPKTVAELESELDSELNDMVSPVEVTKAEIVRKRVLEFIKEEPDTACSLVRTWIMEEE